MLLPLQNAESFLQITEDAEFPEGRVLTRVHTVRERNRTLVRKRKEKALKEKGCLQCDVCGFDFSKAYGSIGDGFIECHHTVPVSELSGSTKTKLKDLALVCSNCHRMLHSIRPWLTVQALKSQLKKRHIGG